MTDRERATGMAGQVQLAIGSGNWGRSAIVDMLVDFASTARAEERERYAGKAEVERDDYMHALDDIANIIRAVDNRCMVADGPVTPTLKEMTQAEISRIYELACLPQQREDERRRAESDADVGEWRI